MFRHIDEETRKKLLFAVHLTHQENAVTSILDEVPTADVEPVRPHGKMIVKERERLIPDAPPTASVDEFGVPFIVRHHKVVKYFYCPVCKNELRDGLVKYCDECGARMDEEEQR